MKYTSLFSAVAVAAAMGTQAFAAATTNDVGSVNFEASEYVAGRLYEVPGVSGLGWTVSSEDNSAIIAAPLSQPGMEAVDGFAGKHLELSTEGQELVYNPGTVSQPKSLIEMKVRLVASETAPSIDATDTTVHAAVYLKADENDPTTDGLYAYAQVDGVAAWTNIADAVSLPGLANGSMLALRVLMDYGTQKVTYEGAILADAENAGDIAYVTLATTDMANPDVNVTALSTIAFKGTGGVDDLFVKQITETATTAYIAYLGFDELSPNEAIDPIDPDTGKFVVREMTVDTEAQGSSATFTADLEETFLNLVVKSIKLYEIVDNAEVERQWTKAPTVAATGDFAVSMANYTFVADSHYIVKIVFGEEGSAVEYVGPKSGAIQILKAGDDDTAYGDDVADLTFTSITLDGTTGTVTFSATILVDDDTTFPATANFVLKAKTALDANTTTDVPVTVTVQSANAGVATGTFTLPAGNALFIEGIDAPAASAGE